MEVKFDNLCPTRNEVDGFENFSSDRTSQPRSWKATNVIFKQKKVILNYFTIHINTYGKIEYLYFKYFLTI